MMGYLKVSDFEARAIGNHSVFRWVNGVQGILRRDVSGILLDIVRIRPVVISGVFRGAGKSRQKGHCKKCHLLFHKSGKATGVL